MPKLIQCIFRAPNNILSHARTPGSSPCSRRAAACATARGGRRRRRGGAESRPAGWPRGCRRAGAAARRGSARVCVRATDSHAACLRCRSCSRPFARECVHACSRPMWAVPSEREPAGGVAPRYESRYGAGGALRRSAGEVCYFPNREYGVWEVGGMIWEVVHRSVHSVIRRLHWRSQSVREAW